MKKKKATRLRLQAKGEVEVQPDIATVHAGVVTTGTTAVEALARNNVLAAQMIETVRNSAIPTRRLQTSRLSVDPRFSDAKRGDGTPKILGYTARNTLAIEPADIAQTGDLISLLFDTGANEIRGPHFSLDDPLPSRQRAEQAAIAAALTQAENYAEALGMKVTRILRVSDSRSGDGPVAASGGWERTRGLAPTPIEPDTITVSATINAEFRLKPR